VWPWFFEECLDLCWFLLWAADRLHEAQPFHLSEVACCRTICAAACSPGTCLCSCMLLTGCLKDLTPPTHPPTQGSPLGASRPLLAVENPCQISYTAVHSKLVVLSGMYMKRNGFGVLALGGV
jgi:hypothetical protein